jgi:tripartite-type tricarboxylate transporter receptor subunit TctC
VPYPVGGTADAMTRALAHEMAGAWGQQVVVENRPGGGTVVGAQAVATAPPDGYTLLFATDSTLTINPRLLKNLPYDPVKSFAPVTLLGFQEFALVVHPTVAANTLEEFVVLAKSKPGALNYGSFGNGSQPHLIMELLKQQAGILVEHIPSKGVAQVVQDLLSGQVQTAFVGVSAAGLIKGGKVRGLAVGGDRRSPLFGDVPTFKEMDYPQMYARAWWGIVATGGTPRPVIEKLNQGLRKIMDAPEFREKRMLAMGLEPAGGTPEAFAALMREDAKQWARVMDTAGIKPE